MLKLFLILYCFGFLFLGVYGYDLPTQEVSCKEYGFYQSGYDVWIQTRGNMGTLVYGEECPLDCIYMPIHPDEIVAPKPYHDSEDPLCSMNDLFSILHMDSTGNQCVALDDTYYFRLHEDVIEFCVWDYKLDEDEYDELSDFE